MEQNKKRHAKKTIKMSDLPVVPATQNGAVIVFNIRRKQIILSPAYLKQKTKITNE